VPTRDDQGQPIANAQELLEKTLRYLSLTFGGATSSDAVGSWVSPSGQIIREHVTLVFSYAQNLSDENTDSLLDHCLWLKEQGHQDSIALELDGELYLI